MLIIFFGYLYALGGLIGLELGEFLYKSYWYSNSSKSECLADKRSLGNIYYGGDDLGNKFLIS